MKIGIKFDKKSLNWITKFPKLGLKYLQEGFKFAVLDAEASAKKTMGKGQAPKVRTGHLRRSIYSIISGFKAVIGSPLKYAAILQYGGKTKPHIIRARHKKALSFIWTGKPIVLQNKSKKINDIHMFRKMVHHPGSKILPHPYVLLGIKHVALRRFEKMIDSHFTNGMQKELDAIK